MFTDTYVKYKICKKKIMSAKFRVVVSSGEEGRERNTQGISTIPALFLKWCETDMAKKKILSSNE